MNVGDIPVVDLGNAIRPLSGISRIAITEHAQDSLFAEDYSRKTESIDLLRGPEFCGTINGAFTDKGRVYLRVHSGGMIDVDVCEVPERHKGRYACWYEPN